MVVIAVIAIMAAVLIPNLLDAQKEADENRETLRQVERLEGEGVSRTR